VCLGKGIESGRLGVLFKQVTDGLVFCFDLHGRDSCTVVRIEDAIVLDFGECCICFPPLYSRC
jgi:hypothetical protein